MKRITQCQNITLVFFCLLSIFACQGGGSSGTGLTDSSIAAGTSETMVQICGALSNTEGAPLVHWTITDLATGNQAEADDFGRFVLSVLNDPEIDAELALSNNQISSEIHFPLPDPSSDHLIIPLEGIGQISIGNCQ